MATPKFTLMEEVLLMCLRKDGDISSGPISHKCPALAIEAAILLELFLKGHISRVMQEERECFIISNEEATGDDLLDEAKRIMKDIKNATFEDWIRNLNGTLITIPGIQGILERVFTRLYLKKIVKKEKGLMSMKYPFDNEEEINQWTQVLKDAIFAASPDALPVRTLCLIGLFQALDKPFVSKVGNALDINRIFPDKVERDKARANLEKLLESSESTSTIDNTAVAMTDAVRKNILRRMIRVAIFGMFNIFFNL